MFCLFAKINERTQFYFIKCGILQGFPALRKATTVCAKLRFFLYHQSGADKSPAFLITLSGWWTNGNCLQLSNQSHLSNFLVSKSIWCLYNKQNDTCLLVNIEFPLLHSTPHFMSECSKHREMPYRSTCTCAGVSFSLFYYSEGLFKLSIEQITRIRCKLYPWSKWR